ncbi:MAG TPA: hypothetical protein VD973_02960 [Symbiobacteriaceae bacterium]|nr:hypothetical protein [Symbiobacteriaceae bacterium]
MGQAPNQTGYVIRIEEPALIQLCLAGLEAYSVAHLREGPRIQLETYGTLWGHKVDLPDGRPLYSVQMATTDTSARMARSSVETAEGSLELKRDLMTSFWPQLEFLGDFHTHPYRHPEEVGPEQYSFSKGDREDIEDRSDFWLRHGYRVGLVLTIAQLKRASSRDHRWLEENTIEFTLGNYRMWLKAYVVSDCDGRLSVSADDDPDVLLDCPALVGLQGEYTPFGRGRSGRGAVRHRTGQIDMNGRGGRA